MGMTVRDLDGRSPDAPAVAELRKRLGRLPESERFAFIQDCLDHGLDGWALALAKTCLRSGEHIVRLLEHGLATADASSIKFWLDLAVAKLGGRRVVSIVAGQIDSNPDGAAKAIYWLPGLLSRQESKTVAAFDELLRLARERNSAGADDHAASDRRGPRPLREHAGRGRPLTTPRARPPLKRSLTPRVRRA